MNITILENKELSKNKEFINRYKFLYIEAKFSEEMLEILYSKIGVSWRSIPTNFPEREIDTSYTNSLKNFKSQFKIYEFDNEKSAKKFLEKMGEQNFNNKILEFNKYQIFWFTNFAKQKQKYAYSFQ